MSLDFEQSFYSRKVKFIVGTDEAGRGPLAGPVVAAAVIFPQGYHNNDINDSKTLTDKKRRLLYDVIKKDAIAIGVGIVDAPTIDKINIYESSREAMIIAINNLHHDYDFVITDAMPINNLDVEVLPVIKGDAKVLCIAAASIIAKVTRDDIMNELDKKYPNYKFGKHKGYGTKDHLDALRKYGPIHDIHRYTYRPVANLSIEQLKLFD